MVSEVCYTTHSLYAQDLPKPEQGKILQNGSELGLPINIQWQEIHGQRKLKHDL